MGYCFKGAIIHNTCKGEYDQYHGGSHARLYQRVRKGTVRELQCVGVITPNKIPLMAIVTYLQKCYRNRISNHWATIPACSVVPPIYKQSKKTYCHVSF